MKLKLLIYLTASFLFVACNKDGSSHLQFGYPDGVIVADIVSVNDCSLPECSDRRVVRLFAKNVVGQIRESIHEEGIYYLSYVACDDCVIRFYFCNLPLEFQEHRLEVKYSGFLIDACGIREATWPAAEVYILKVTKIEEI